MRLDEGLLAGPAPIEPGQLFTGRQGCERRTLRSGKEMTGDIFLEWANFLDVDADFCLFGNGQHRLSGAVAQVEVNSFCAIAEIELRLTPAIVGEADGRRFDAEITREDKPEAGPSHAVAPTIDSPDKALGSLSFIVGEQCTGFGRIHKGLIQGPVPDIDRDRSC